MNTKNNNERTTMSKHNRERRQQQDKPTVNIVGGSAWNTVSAIQDLAKKQGGYTWQADEANEPIIVVRDKVKLLLNQIDFQAVMGQFVKERQTNWHVIVHTFERLLPHGLDEGTKAVLMDLLLIFYAYNMGVSIPYIGMAEEEII
jgi:hypothetical protein